MVSTPTILAIDLGKFNSVFCAFDVATKTTAFRSIETTPANFRDAIARQPSVTVVGGSLVVGVRGWPVDRMRRAGRIDL